MARKNRIDFGNGLGYHNYIMILSIGEILADVLLNPETGEMRAHVGGAPFNVAVNAAQSGGEAAFCGRVGNDPLGKFLEKEAAKYPLKIFIQKDESRPTTMAFVSIDENGERDFRFTRENAADYHIEADEKIFEALNPSTVHLGSLMLSEEAGRKTADAVVALCDKFGAKLSFDINFREDVFGSVKDAAKTFAPYIRRADVVKFSKEELESFYGKDLGSALKELDNPVVCVTCGKEGSIIHFHGKEIFVATKPVRCVDTTGAGDAFFGAFLACMDGKYEVADETAVKLAAETANKKGAEATLFEGAVKL